MAIKRVWNAFLYSISGLKDAIKTQTAFRIELALGLVLFPLALILGQNGIERNFLIGSLMIVLIVELINSSIEAAIDRISLERHELSRKSKDLASAAVFLSLVNVPIVWLLILFQ